MAAKWLATRLRRTRCHDKTPFARLPAPGSRICPLGAPADEKTANTHRKPSQAAISCQYKAHERLALTNILWYFFQRILLEIEVRECFTSEKRGRQLLEFVPSDVKPLELWYLSYPSGKHLEPIASQLQVKKLRQTLPASGWKFNKRVITQVKVLHCGQLCERVRGHVRDFFNSFFLFVIYNFVIVWCVFVQKNISLAWLPLAQLILSISERDQRLQSS